MQTQTKTHAQQQDSRLETQLNQGKNRLKQRFEKSKLAQTLPEK
jgi:hypothetical protein